MHPQITAARCDFSDKDEVRAATGAGESRRTLMGGLARPVHGAGMRLLFPKSSCVQNFHSGGSEIALDTTLAAAVRATMFRHAPLVEWKLRGVYNQRFVSVEIPGTPISRLAVRVTPFRRMAIPGYDTDAIETFR
jgi:hypothetical protein